MRFPAELNGELQDRLRGAAHLPIADVADILGRQGMSIEELMVALLPLAAERARVPVSGFKVGAVALGMPPEESPQAVGALYLGANLEFAGLPLSTTVHAEQAAVNNAWLHNESGLQALAVTAAPCGHCRQFLYELSTASSLRIVIPSGGKDPDSRVETNLRQLLPLPFGSADLGFEGGLMSSRKVVVPPLGLDRFRLAEVASQSSYAPYTGVPGGAAIGTVDGRQFLGRIAENAAFNPTLQALPSALSALGMTQRATDPWNLEWAVVTLPQDRQLLPDVTTRSGAQLFCEGLLRSVAPQIRLQTVRLDRC